MADSIVYFIKRHSDGAIKIGITTNLCRRMTDLRHRHGQLSLLATVEGAATREKLAHLIFGDVRLDGEFFQPTSDLRTFIEQYGTPVTVDPSEAPLGPTSTRQPWIEKYGDPFIAHQREEVVRDYQKWIAEGLITEENRRNLEVIRTFPETIVFVPQRSLPGWGWSPLNPRCWASEDGRRLYV